MARVCLSLFVTGVVLGYGPCLFSCGPLLTSYITATRENAWAGLKTYIVFSLTRLFVYAVFGLLVGFFGEWVVQRFFESQAIQFLFLFFGLFLILLGFFLAVDKIPIGQKCPSLISRYLGQKDLKNIVIFGLIVSLSPCLPLIGIMGYIALISDHWLKGVLYMTVFGLGTVFSPMIVLSMLGGWLAKVLKKNEKVFRILKFACGVIISYLGMSLVWAVIRSIKGF